MFAKPDPQNGHARGTEHPAVFCGYHPGSGISAELEGTEKKGAARKYLSKIPATSKTYNT